MKFIGLIIVLVLTCLNGFSQVSKVYIMADGTYSDSPSKAQSYILIERLEDTAYSVSQFSMGNFMMVKGLYKDKTLSTPNGKFSYYATFLPAGDKKHFVSYLQMTGYFVNGVKSGPWLQYHHNGNKFIYDNYANDKLNGSHQVFFEDGVTIEEEGKYVDDSKEGAWNNYNQQFKMPATTEIFENNKLVKQIVHYQPAVIYEDFYSYIKETLKPYFDTLTSKRLELTLFVNDKGKVDSVKSESIIERQFYIAIIRAFLNAPNIVPATFDKQPVSEMRVLNLANLGYGYRNEDAEQRAHRIRAGIYSRHANEIGRGLNSVGIGKPVY